MLLCRDPRASSRCLQPHRPSSPLPLRLGEQQVLLEATANSAPASPGSQLTTLIYVSGLGLGSTTSAGGGAGSSHSPKQAPPAQT